jgi:hypothetical protein
MKTFILFKVNGEIEKKKTDSKTFSDAANFSFDLKFTNYVKYTNYIILHNSNSRDYLNVNVNKTVFYFTPDRFKGDVALVKIENDNLIKNLTIDDYFKKLTKTLQENSKNIIYSDSDSDSDVDLSVYGKILTKEPFDYNYN